MSAKYDVVIIGAGIAGLCTGLYLQKMGKRSLILEHGSQPGGVMAGITRKGFYFDCGDQSMENVGVLFPILAELGLYDPAEWMQVHFRYVTEDCSVPMGDYDQIRDDFKKAFPESTAGIDKWFELIGTQCRIFKEMMNKGNFPMVLDGWKRWQGNIGMFRKAMGMTSAVRELMFKTGPQKGEELFPRDPRLAFLFGEFGAPNMMLMMHLSFWYSYVNDYWYPRAGIQGMLDKLADAYRERGGEILFKTTVDKIVTAGNSAIAVETAQEERFTADYFVNTGNPKRLINQMLDHKEVWPYKDRQIISAAPVSGGVSSAYLGLNISNAEFKRYLPEHHTMYFRTYETASDPYDPEYHNKGWSMINATSVHLPHLAPEGQSSLVVQVFTPYHWLNGWGTGSADPQARNQAYRKLKAKVLEDIIKKTEYVIPGLAEKIVYKELATPRSLARWTLNPEGSPYGWSYDLYATHRAYKFAQFTTPIKNLFSAGHYAMWPGGVIFAALAGRIVAKGIYEGFWKQLAV